MLEPDIFHWQEQIMLNKLLSYDSGLSSICGYKFNTCSQIFATQEPVGRVVLHLVELRSVSFVTSTNNQLIIHNFWYRVDNFSFRILRHRTHFLECWKLHNLIWCHVQNILRKIVFSIVGIIETGAMLTKLTLLLSLLNDHKLSWVKFSSVQLRWVKLS